MNFFDYIRSWFIWITNVLVGAAMDAYRSWLPLDWLGDALNYLSSFTSMVAGYLWDASKWYEEVKAAVLSILSWDTIKSLVRSWLVGIESAIAWFLDWWNKVGQRIDSWWLAAQQTVRDWISAATQGFESLKAAWDNFTRVTLPSIFSQLELLRANWSQFWTVTFPSLVTLSGLTTWWNSRLQDVQSLIKSALANWDDLFTWWGNFRQDVVTFFTDPWAWLYDKLDDFIERFW